MIRTLRARLIVGIISAMLLLLATFSLIVYSVIRRNLINQFDASLVSIAQILAASVELDGDEVELEFEVQQMPEFQDRNRPTYYQLWRLDGTVVAKSHLLEERNLPLLLGCLEEPDFRVIKSSAGLIEHAVGFSFTPRLSDDDSKLSVKQTLMLTVARDASDLYQQLGLLRWLLIAASGVTIVLSVLIAAIVVCKGLNPLSRIAAEIAAISEEDLAARIETKSVPTEILPIKNRLNDLLSRLEEAFKRERRFTSDVAHELRTPLAGIRSTIEVNLARDRDTIEYQAVLSECLTIVESMQGMMSNLLMIARLDAHQINIQRVQIELAELINSCWQSFSDKALEREIVFENHVTAEMVCDSDQDKLSIVLKNLLDNAVEYTNKTGLIRITARQSSDSIEITVSNTGCELTNEQVSQLFDSFWRGDLSRKDTGAHCGLGLALVQRLVKALGGSVSAKIQDGGVFTVQLNLPNKGMSR